MSETSVLSDIVEGCNVYFTQSLDVTSSNTKTESCTKLNCLKINTIGHEAPQFLEDQT